MEIIFYKWAIGWSSSVPPNSIKCINYLHKSLQLDNLQ